MSEAGEAEAPDPVDVPPDEPEVEDPGVDDPGVEDPAADEAEEPGFAAAEAVPEGAREAGAGEDVLADASPSDWHAVSDSAAAITAVAEAARRMVVRYCMGSPDSGVRGATGSVPVLTDGDRGGRPRVAAVIQL
ncbi:hypothetical protein ACIHEJ_29640 [Streptomyces sp. NPDC052301]|uniref:hypothetical protein n=1 Tax=Streptomyces sp. NPDC052301 TaxID=3365687 RepID=UPI0037D861BA